MASFKSFRVPVPIVNQREANAIETLNRRYEKLVKSGAMTRMSKKALEMIPDSLKESGNKLADNINEQLIIKQAIDMVGDTFHKIQAQAAKYTVSQTSIIEKVNAAVLKHEITELNQICFARSYEVAKVVNAYKSQDALVAFVSGGITGSIGFWGLPFSLALSSYLFYRAVQSIAMFYGYDVKNDSAELIIVSEVFASSLSPSNSETNNELSGSIAKFMLFGKAAAIEQTVKKGWTKMAERGSETLLLTQIRALANAAAKKALEKTGKANLERHLFKESLEQIGKKLTQKAIMKYMWIFSAAVGAFIDTAQMNRVLEYADVFYQKRFILEKEARVQAYFDEDDIEITE